MSSKPSIVLISIDSLRADCVPFAEESVHLRSLGLTRPKLPIFNALVQGASVFSQVIACSSYTSTCHASMLTGLVPPEHGVRAFIATSLADGVRTLPEILAENGYDTCGMIDRPAPFQPQGLLRGFQYLVSDEDEALAWWDSHEGSPRLLFCHIWDVHYPYGMPVGRTFRSMYPAIVDRWTERLRSDRIALPDPATDVEESESDRRLVTRMQHAWCSGRGFKFGMQDYIDGLLVFDRFRLQRLAEALRSRRILDKAALIITADHGEGRDMPPSPLLRHGNLLRDDQISVPLFVTFPGMRGQERITQQVSQADITPTILDLAGLSEEGNAPRTTCDGRSLMPLLRGRRLPEQAAYAEISTIYADPTAAVRIAADRINPLIRHRILRYPDRKYWLVGKPDPLTQAQLGAPASEMVTALYHDVLGRRPSQDEQKRLLAFVQAAPQADVTARQGVAQRFERSGEFEFLPKYAIFDLRRDPLEVKPVDARHNPADWTLYQHPLGTILEIERAGRPGEPLLTNEADEQVILRRLQNLGYVE